MPKIDPFDLAWRANEIDKISDDLYQEIAMKLYEHPLQLNTTELHLLRERLVTLHVHSEALQTHVATLKEELNVPLWKRILRK